MSIYYLFTHIIVIVLYLKKCAYDIHQAGYVVATFVCWFVCFSVGL